MARWEGLNEIQTAVDGRARGARPGGLFISFEGIDGCGKSTQISLLEQRFSALGRSPRLIREPGGTALGEAVRQILLSSEMRGMSARSECLLFTAARAQLVERVIAPALAADEIVLCDRFIDSTLAYQGFGRELGTKDIAVMLDWATGGLKPDLTLLLDIDAKLALRRRSGRNAAEEDRIEAEGLRFMERVRRGYLQLAEADRGRFVVLDAALSEAEVFSLLSNAIEERLGDVFKV